MNLQISFYATFFLYIAAHYSPATFKPLTSMAPL